MPKTPHLLCLLLLALGPATFQATSQTSPAPQSSGTPSGFSQSIFPLSAVHAGMHGTAYSVFEGSTPEPINVEVLGILQDAIGPKKSMILVRLTGSRPESTGVAAGMSGSPVYIEGKLVGAIGFRIGQFTHEAIAGVTPADQMFEVLHTQQNAPAPPAAIAASPAAESASSAISAPVHSASLQIPFANTVLQPIETPLVVNGFSPEAIRLFQQRVPSLGLTPVSGLGGASPQQIDKAPVVPGSAVSAIIVDGDFHMAASCTVTYVDARHLLACGHPITHFGDISLPMTKSVVVTTIASSLDPMKILNTTQTVGAFTQDRQSGILGVFGETARMIPVEMQIGSGSAAHTYHFTIAEHPRLTTAALVATVYQALQDTNSYNDPASYRMQGEIQLTGYPPVKIDDWLAPENQQPASIGAITVLSQRFDRIFSNPRQLPQIDGVRLTFDPLPDEQATDIAAAHVLNPVVHPGDRITVEAVLHSYRQPAQLVHLDARLPATLSSGPVRLLVSDGATLDHTFGLVPSPTAPALNLRETVARLNQLHPTNRLYVTLLAPQPQATLPGHDLPAVPLTMANVLEPQGSTDGYAIHGETAVPLNSMDLQTALKGSQVVTLNVEP